MNVQMLNKSWYVPHTRKEGQEQEVRKSKEKVSHMSTSPEKSR
jgi:hypothetical protein